MIGDSTICSELAAKYFYIDDDLVETLKRYVVYRCQTGGFLEAVLSNDLRGACERADLLNQSRLFAIVEFIYNELPSVCWGSPEKVKNWLSGRAVVRA